MKANAIAGLILCVCVFVALIIWPIPTLQFVAWWVIAEVALNTGLYFYRRIKSDSDSTDSTATRI